MLIGRPFSGRDVMKNHICFSIFVLLCLTSCTTGLGDNIYFLDYTEAKEKEEKSDDDNLSTNTCIKNESPYKIVVFKDSLREEVLCNVNAYDSVSIYMEPSLTDTVCYVTYYIKLSEDFSIPYYSNDCFVIVPSRQRDIQSVIVYSPDEIQIQDCYVIIQNECKKEIFFKYGNSELISLDNNGAATNHSSIILPEEEGLYKINPMYFENISNYSISTSNGNVFNLADKIVSFKPGCIYKLIIKNTSNGKNECLLKSISSFVINPSNGNGLEEISEVFITYNTNCSSKISTKRIPIGKSLSSLELPVIKRPGYTFSGWYLGSKKITSGYLAMENLTLSAKWSLTNYTASTLNQLDLSRLEDEYILCVCGNLTESDLNLIASKIEKANKNITLDLYRVTGLTEINCRALYEYSSRFGKCYYMKSIRLPYSLKKVGDYAFTYCRHLEKVEISEGTTSLGSFTFYNCTNLKSITIPNSITAIGYAPFSYCSSLSTINYRGTKAQWNSISKNNWRENAYSCISKVVCSDGIIELNR